MEKFELILCSPSGRCVMEEGGEICGTAIRLGACSRITSTVTMEEM